jgi:succinate-semialdehyde dehydrogenase/glutarate-semialdehyde dehydrogenase
LAVRARFTNTLERQVQQSVAMGARLHTGGHRMDGPGSYFAPTVLTDVTPDMPVFSEETFGPIAAVVRADSPEDAIRPSPLSSAS